MITHTKRDFLGLSAAGLATAAAGMSPALLLAAQQAGSTTKFSSAGFRQAMHSVFSVGNRAGSHEDLALVDVAQGPASPHVEQFAITLSGSEARPLPEGIYDVVHPDMGRFQLHIQPVDAAGGARHYRSVFSLIRPGFRTA